MRKLKAFLLLLPLFLVLLVPALLLAAESAPHLSVPLSDVGTGVAAGGRPAAQCPQPLPRSGLRMGRAALSEPGPVPGAASPSVVQGCATEGYGLEAELLELLAALVPEGWEGWLALGFGLCALLSVILPEPSESAHPALKCGHRALSVLGLGASRLKAAGRLGKLVSLGKRLRP